jgi:hypothetical protein
MSETLKKHSFKIQVGTIATVIIFIVSMTAWVVGERTEMRHDIVACTQQAEVNKAHIVALESSDQQQNIIQARIEVQLAQIFTILEEIKRKL